VKGIILAGGLGSRLYPLTLATSKQLLPVYDKPMIYYPLSVLMLAGIRDILVICTPQAQSDFRRTLGDGSQWGLTLEYAVQAEPRGLADALLVGADFIDNQPVCLILGDNIFFGHGLPETLRQAAVLDHGAKIFAYRVQNPSEYGVVEFDEEGYALSLEEKPDQARSIYAVPGLYFYDDQAVSLARNLKPSERNELEITDLNRAYLEKHQLKVQQLGRGIAWLDAGTHQSLLQATNFIQAVQERQGMMISCPEEIAWRMGYIDDDRLARLAASLGDNRYRAYLSNLIDDPT
jgi:glucose-1-phosphate thymidylyltransferase